jgi:hypothetical protein
MALEFKLYERTERTELGTPASFAGIGGKVALVPSNFINHNKRVVLVIKQSNGKSAMVTCSSNVSEGLRAQEITLTQVQSFPLVEQLTTEGEIINLVIMPSGKNQLVEVDVTAEVVEFDVPTLDITELVAF